MSVARALPFPSVAAHSRLDDYAQIAKPRLSLLVLLTTLVGFFFGSSGGMDLWRLLETLFGTALVAVGSGALNQVLEHRHDAKMARTAGRPLPAGHLSIEHVLYLGVGVTLAGLAYLTVRVNVEAAAIAALTLVLYVFAYTPLKRVTSLNTLVGALPGALPPLIGYVAAREQLDWPAYVLFAILFVWQLPHFLAIAWLYRDQYEAAGLRMLPGGDPDGIATGMQMMVHACTLLPLSVLPACSFSRMSGRLYLSAALGLGAVFLVTCVWFAIKRNDRAARKVFLMSVIYLPLLLSMMMFDSN